MARPLRIEIPNGRYHLTSRGNERSDIFRHDRDRLHFLELLSELPARFGVRIFAYVLMDNHYHLLLETPEANLSRTAQWLNVSYSVWFNRRYRRSGHLLQGRFKAVLIQDPAGLQRVARYLHLNPARVMSLGLDKSRQKALARGLAGPAQPQAVPARLQRLRAYQWSSYPALAGYRASPAWLTLQPLRQLCGGRTQAEQVAALRRYTENAIREGLPESPWEHLLGGVVLGTKEFARQLMNKVKTSRREQPAVARLGGRLSWTRIVQAVQTVKGETWAAFGHRHGDWGRDASLWLGRYAGRMRLAQLAQEANCDYTTVGKAVSRFGQRLVRDRYLAQKVESIKNELSKFEI